MKIRFDRCKQEDGGDVIYLANASLGRTPAAKASLASQHGVVTISSYNYTFFGGLFIQNFEVQSGSVTASRE